MLASHVDQQTHRLEGELYHLRQRLIHVEAGLSTSWMRTDSLETEAAGLRHHLLATERRAVAGDERSLALEQVMRAGAQEMSLRFPPPPAHSSV